VGGTAVGSAGGSVAAGAGGSVAAGVAAGAPQAANIWLNTSTNTTKIIFQLFIFCSFLNVGKRFFLLKSEQQEQ
jgi:hypothetical protein